MGADSDYDRKNSYNPLASIKASPTNSAEKAFDSAMANMDKVLAKSNPGKNELIKAMDRLNNATDKYAKSVLSTISSSSTTETNTGPSEGISTGRGGGGNLTATPITPVSAITYTPPAPPVKTATPDIVLFNDETVPIEVMEDLLFENIGGQELINIARSDTINGQPISYQPIKNISAIQQQYNPNNIVSLQQTSNRFFAGFSIKLEDRIPNEGNGSNGSNIYIDTDNGNLTIELVKLEADEQVEIQIVTNGTIYEDTVEGFTSW